METKKEFNKLMKMLKEWGCLENLTPYEVGQIKTTVKDIVRSALDAQDRGEKNIIQNLE
jgi:hypothetical protein